MAERILVLKDDHKIQSVDIRFFTLNVARLHRVSSLITPSESETLKYAVAVAIGASGLIVKAALVDVDERKYNSDKEYKAEVKTKINEIFDFTPEKL